MRRSHALIGVIALGAAGVGHAVIPHSQPGGDAHAKTQTPAGAPVAVQERLRAAAPAPAAVGRTEEQGAVAVRRLRAKISVAPAATSGTAPRLPSIERPARAPATGPPAEVAPAVAPAPSGSRPFAPATNPSRRDAAAAAPVGAP
jgi:hypothetical protein